MLSLPRHFRFFVVLIAFLALGMRSLIPVGYMPDFSGHGKGLLPLTFCDGFEHAAQDEHSGHMHHHHDGQQHQHGSRLCPFGASTFVSYILPEMAVAAPPVYYSLPLTFTVGKACSNQRVFYNASPRSPPFFS